MYSSAQRFGRLLVALGLASLAAGPVWVGLIGLGLPSRVAAAVTFVALLAIVWRGSGACASVANFLAPRPWHTAAAAVALVVAATMTIGLAAFIDDPQRREWSAQPASDFYVAHSCLTALTEAVHQARGGHDVYTVPSREKLIAGRFEADPYFYSPPFMLAPAALMLANDDFLAERRLWFALQALTLLAALLLVAHTVGAEPGARVVWTVPLLFLAPPVLLNLQIGNPQVTVFAVAMMGMCLLDRWPRIGSALLAVGIVAKLFPAILVAYLVGQKRWRAVAWTCGWCLLMTAGGVLLFGLRPINDYIVALPSILDGSTPATSVWTNNLWLAPTNQSIYGLTRKLVALGIPFITPSLEAIVQSAYGIAIMAFAAFIGTGMTREASSEALRLRSAIVWLALLTLAAFRSPFLPDGYAYVGTLWLGTLLLASIPRLSWPVVVIGGVAWVALTPILGGRAIMPQPLKVLAAVTLLVQVIVMAVTAYAAWMGRAPFTLADRRSVVADRSGGLAA